MYREPLALYIFRVFLGLGLFFFMVMLYWSSNLIEEQVIEIREEIEQLERKTSRISEELNRPRPTAEQREAAQEKREHLQKDLPNLLEVDPFYAETLPDMLGPNFQPEHTLRSATVGKPDNLHPFSNWSNVSTWTNQCTLSVSRLKFGKYETMAPYMAIKMEERPRKNSELKEYWVHLRGNVYWQPLQTGMVPEEIDLAPHFRERHQVTARDFKFYFDAAMNPFVQLAGAISLRTYLGDIEEIEIVDDLTFIVRWKNDKYSAKLLTGELRPLPGFVYQYFSDGSKIIEKDDDPNTYRTNSVWAQNFNDHWAKNIIVSCGPWIFDGMNDQNIKFRRNPNHFFPLDVLIDEQQITFKNSPDSIWQDFQTAKVDTYILQPDQIFELEDFLNSEAYLRQPIGISRLEYLARSYSYIGWNMAKPYFQSKKVRQALTMAIDRRRIIQQILNGLGEEITGPFFRNSPSYDTEIKPWPYNIQKAKLLLEEEEWFDSEGDGVRDKLIGGSRVPFEFSLTYYVKNPTTKAICEYVATALRDIGVKCRLNGVDIADLSASFDDKSFDALCLGWALGTPPEDPSQLWHSKWADVKGSSNAVGFANKEADQIIEQLQFEKNHEKRIALYHQFHEIIHGEQPYTFLYSPKSVLLYRDYVQNVFIPARKQDLIPGANIAEPSSSIFWLKKPEK